MGTRVAPSYANIFMGSFEKTYIYNNEECKPHILVYKRYITDLFLIWKGDETKAMNFVQKIYSNKWRIKLTPKFAPFKIEFLDLMISQENNRFTTSTYFRSVDTNSYLHYRSHHYKKWKKNIPYGQFRCIRKNCTSDSIFEEQATIIQERFTEKGYPKPLLTKAYERTKKISQREYLGIPTNTPLPLTTDDGVKPHSQYSLNFITTFNNSHQSIRQILTRNWFIL